MRLTLILLVLCTMIFLNRGYYDLLNKRLDRIESSLSAVQNNAHNQSVVIDSIYTKQLMIEREIIGIARRR